jgi:phospholipid/cholesterol/gamma-HCH transport system substrate-binding protein
MPSNRLAAVGAFVIGGVLLFGIGLFMIGNRRMLFADTFTVYAEFAGIAGLDNGAPVRVAGMDAGEVERIQVPPGPPSPFRVQMRVRRDLQPLIRQDSVASIQNDGIVGNKFVQIETGSERAPALPDGGTVRSREPFDLADLLEKMSGTVDTVNATILSLQTEIEDALKALTTTARSVDELVTGAGGDAREIMASSSAVAADLKAIVAGLREGRGVVGKLLTDDALYDRAKAIAADAERAVAGLREASAEARAALAQFRSQGGSIQGLTDNLDQTLTAARDAMADLADNTEALKRNFLFRGFFTRRGYFDLDDLTVQQYRAGALEGTDRRALRIWVLADRLFERDDRGQERLTEDGRARIDSAMSQFVRYPRTSPFVVEGYAARSTAAERYLVSRARAQIVRDYVVGKFGLDPNVVTTMALGDEADESPSGRTWDGVALAIFVPRG